MLTVRALRAGLASLSPPPPRLRGCSCVCVRWAPLQMASQASALCLRTRPQACVRRTRHAAPNAARHTVAASAAWSSSHAAVVMPLRALVSGVRGARSVVRPVAQSATQQLQPAAPGSPTRPLLRAAACAAAVLALAAATPGVASAAALATPDAGLLSYLVSFVLHLDKHLSSICAQYGTRTYAILFAIVFAETARPCVASPEARNTEC